MNRYDPNMHHRQSIRLPSYDYAQAGAYFVTLCAHGWECLFGIVDNSVMVLNEYGKVVREEWLKSAEIRSEIHLGEFVIMPNHFHAIVYIVDHRNACRGDRPVAPRPLAPTGSKPKSLGALMAGFKSAVTKRINAMRNTPGHAVWQRNYYEHVIRNETDYYRVAEYIADNPCSWQEDSLHPANQTGGKTNAMHDTGFARTPADGVVETPGSTALVETPRSATTMGLTDLATSAGATGSAVTNDSATIEGATGRSPLQAMPRLGGDNE